MIPDPDLICFSGDWHGNTVWAKDAIEIAANCGAQAILHTGDFGFKFNRNFMSAIRHKLDECDMHLYFVDGNHDEHPVLFHRWPTDEDGFGQPQFGGIGSHRLHYVPRGHRWKWWDKTFMGLGGAASVDKNWRTPYVDWWPEEMITTADVYRATAGGKVDVMITHDIPAKAILPNDRKSMGNPEWPESALIASEQNRQMLQAVVDEVQPELLVHGHFHIRDEQQVGGLHIVSLDKDYSTMERNLYLVDERLENRTLVDRQPSAKAGRSARRTLIDKIDDMKE